MTRPDSFPPVLIVDDDEEIRRTLARVLGLAGCPAVAAAANGQECLHLVRQGFRGLILMDIMMPGMDGWAAIRALVDGGLLPGNVICMLTALVDPGAGSQGLHEYVFDYLVKPFDVSRLLEIVRLASAHLAP